MVVRSYHHALLPFVSVSPIAAKRFWFNMLLVLWYCRCCCCCRATVKVATKTRLSGRWSWKEYIDMGSPVNPTGRPDLESNDRPMSTSRSQPASTTAESQNMNVISWFWRSQQNTQLTFPQPLLADAAGRTRTFTSLFNALRLLLLYVVSSEFLRLLLFRLPRYIEESENKSSFNSTLLCFLDLLCHARLIGSSVRVLHLPYLRFVGYLAGWWQRHRFVRITCANFRNRTSRPHLVSILARSMLFLFWTPLQCDSDCPTAQVQRSLISSPHRPGSSILNGHPPCLLCSLARLSAQNPYSPFTAGLFNFIDRSIVDTLQLSNFDVNTTAPN